MSENNSSDGGKKKEFGTPTTSRNPENSEQTKK